MSETRWRLVCEPAELDALRGDPRFVALTRLARAANALRFALDATTEGHDDGAPAVRRRRLNGFLLLAELVHGTLALGRQLAAACGESDAWAAGFGTLLADPGAMAYADEALGAVRAAVPFAVDAVARPTARAGGGALFGEGHGQAPGAFYYSLADEALLAAALDVDAPAGAPFYDAMKEHLESAATLAQQCAEAADRLIAELLQQQPWRLEQS